MRCNQHNLLFLAYYFPPLGMGGVQRATKFARYLPHYNWQPHVITVKNIHYYAKDESLLKEVQGLPIYRSGSFDPARLAKFFSLFIDISRRLPPNIADKSFPVSSESKITKILRNYFYPDSKLLWLPFAKRKILSLQRKLSFQAVFSTSPPISSHILAAKMKMPWIADFRDYWSIGDGIYAPTEWHIHRYRHIMSLITRRASKIIAVSEPIADAIRSVSTKKDKNKIVVIPNGFDPKDFQGISPVQFDRFTFIYTGNLNPQRSPKSLFLAFEELLKNEPEWNGKLQCLFIGKHFELDMKHIPKKIIPLVRFVDYMPHSDSLAYLTGAHAQLLILTSDSAPGVISGKVFEYIGTGKPILAIIPSYISAYQLLRKIPNCYFADPDDIQSIKGAISRLLRDYFSKPPVFLNQDKLPPYLIPYLRSEQTRKVAELLNVSVNQP